jgi:NAD(P)-dependent dehydrogenase (short-subunit alcohol dehydrogenase family)
VTEQSLTGRTVLVLGGGGALGAGLVTAFAAGGADVVALDRGVVPNERRADGVDYRQVDLGDEGSVAQTLDAVRTPWAVINTVGGFAPYTPMADLDLAVLAGQLDLNLRIPVLVTKHALRVMIPAGAGRLVHTGSRAAIRTAGSGLAYSVSKAGVHHLVAMAAEETRGTGVTVNAVIPSVIDTPANRAAMPNADHSKWPRIDQLAAVYLFLASPAAELVNGACVPAYGAA